ncbi:sororin [Limanda limanda]|uniref:sororin n=1 Tax=Limanda limanda TaxID=27771 RepID=UPI0029C95078|nr:sororin [Limanda limanda]
MKGGTPRSVMTESNRPSDPLRRRSPRLSSPPPGANLKTDNKMAATSLAVKRRITVRKIAPRKTTAPSEHDKENTPRPDGDLQQKVSTPGPAPDHGSSSTAKKKKQKAALPSPILPPSPPPSRPQESDPDAVWSQKVRRSYSRLSDRSLNSPDPRETLFGFEKLTTPEVGPRGRRCHPGQEASGSVTGLSSFTSLLEAEDGGPAETERDPNIPGVPLGKEKRSRRRKVPQIATVELEAMAAEMNAVFEEAEEFELVVE